MGVIKSTKFLTKKQMERIQNQKHNKETLYYSLSRMLERASFYGFRILIVLYMIGEVLQMDRTEAMNVYGWFIGSLMFSQIVGGLLGDLLIGNRKSIIIGGIVQALGAFALCIPFTMGLYVGLFLVVLGSGFYTPNILSSFGKSYLNKAKLLDSGFTILYLSVNLGSFLGILIIGYLGENIGYRIGFLTSGILMLLSIVPVLILKESAPNDFIKNKFSINKKIIAIGIAFIAVGLYWGIYQIGHIQISYLQMEFVQIPSLNFSQNLWPQVNNVFIISTGAVAVLLWTFFYSTQFIKLTFGFIFGAISFGILLFIPEIPQEQHITLFFIALLFLGISEIHIAPIIHSVLTKYSNPKYLTILISLSLLPSMLIAWAFTLINDKFYEEPMLGLWFAIIAMCIVGIGVFGFVLWNKKCSKDE